MNVIRFCLFTIVVVVYFVTTSIHDIIAGFIIGKNVTRGFKSGHVIVKDRLGFIDGTYKNTFDFWRGKKLY